jgi:FkbM family methyltransferase
MEKQFEIIETLNGNFLINRFDLIGNFIMQTGNWEPHLYEFYSKVLSSEDTVIDAGANLGYHAIQFGFLSKKVYAFEPQSLVFNQLCANILFNDLNDIIIPFKYALGDKNEIKQMWAIEKEDFGHGIYNWGGRGLEHNQAAHTSNESREYDQVQVTTLDSFGFQSCSLFKIDIQGYEYYAFMGAKNLIEKNKPIILLESAPDRSELDVKVLEYLKELGYENYRYYINTNEDCILIHPDNKKYNICLEQIDNLKYKYNIKKDF